MFHHKHNSASIARRHAKLEQEIHDLHVNALTAALSHTGFFRGHKAAYWQAKSDRVAALQAQLVKKTCEHTC